MKKVLSLLMLFAAMTVAVPVANAQKTDKQLKKELKAKVDKDSKKTAKSLQKQGWKVMPGKLPLQKQLQAAKYAELDVNDQGDKRYFIGTHQAVGGNYTAAKQIADNRARVEIAQHVQSSIQQKIQEQVANKDFGDGDIMVIDEFVSANTSLISARLQGITPVLEIYRETGRNQFEVMVVEKIDAAKALKDAKMGLQSELKTKSQKLSDDLDKLIQ